MKVLTYLLVFVGLLSQSIATAQITLTSANAPVARTAHRTREVDSTAAKRLVISAGSATAQTWNFSTIALDPAPASLTTFAVTTGAPSASSFPTATLISREGLTNAQGVTYHRINTSEWAILGDVDDMGQVTVNQDPQIAFKYPFTLNSTFKDTFMLDDPNLGTVEFKSVATGDAWGTIQLPLGTFNALRVKRVVAASLTLFGIPIKIDAIRNEWWTNQHSAPVLLHQRTIVNAPIFATGVDTSYEAIVLSTQTVGVQEAEMNHISNTFPSPANTLMTLDIDVPNAAKVAALIVSMNGQTFKTRSFGDLQAGKQQVNFDVSDIPSGTYQVILMSDKGKLGTQKIVIAH
jgi:hypothetical protein